MDALYFRVSSDRQTTENQFADLLQVAEKDDSARDWPLIRDLLSKCVFAEEASGQGPTRTVYRVRPDIVSQLIEHCIYVEQGRSSRKGAATRPLLQQLRSDAAQRKFKRLLVWKVSRLVRDTWEVIDTVRELADAGVTVVALKSRTEPIDSRMGKLLWMIQSWYAEIENDERSDAIKAGQARALASGKKIGRPQAIFDREEVVRLRDKEGMSWSQIAKELGIGTGTVRRAYHALNGSS